MNIYQLKTNTVYLLFATILFSTSTFAQFACEIGNRNWFYQVEKEEIEGNDNNKEYSGLAYHPERDILFMPICTPIPPFDNPSAAGSISMKGYNLNIEAYNDFDVVGNNDFDVTFIDEKKLLTANDFEGLSHLKADYFALLEETENKIYFLKYFADNQQFEVLHEHQTNIAKNYAFSNTFGLAGISYDPNMGILYVLDEYNRKLYYTSIVLPGEQLPNGNFSTAFMVEGKFTDNSVNLGDDKPDERFHLASGLFHLGQIYPVSHPLANNIIVISFIASPLVTRTLLEFKLSIDQNNNLSLDLVKEIDFKDIKTTNNEVEYKPEGIVLTENTIYVASEFRGLSSYTKKSIGDKCTDGFYIYNEGNQACECVACPTELWMNTNTYNVNEDDDISLAGLYKSAASIKTVKTNSSKVDVIIFENETVDLESDHITLNEGFKVESGACLNAEIDPCE